MMLSVALSDINMHFEQESTTMFNNFCFQLALKILINDIDRLIIKSSFELTFWIQLDLKSNCSHFQLESSWVEHIFNLTRFDSTENWVNSTRFIQNSSLTSRELNIEIFPLFALFFCIIFLHLILIKSESHEEEHEDRLIKNHDEKTWRSIDRKSWRETWRLFDRKIW